MSQEPTITKVTLKDLLTRKPYQAPAPVEKMDAVEPIDLMTNETSLIDDIASTASTVFKWVKVGTLITPAIVQLMYGLAVNNWKTTVTAILGALAVVLKTLLGIEIPTEAILTVTVFFIGLFAKDHNVTGGTKQQ